MDQGSIYTVVCVNAHGFSTLKIRGYWMNTEHVRCVKRKQRYQQMKIHSL